MDQSGAQVSVVIPVYNMEAYLERCLASVAAQTFSDFEVIVVDDGSADRSPEIARRFAAQHPRFTLITQPNQGPAAARNAGITRARGEYLAFVDSDDFVEPNFLEELVRAAVAQDADVVCCNFNRCFVKSEARLPHLLCKLPDVYAREPILKSLLHDVTMQSYVWNKLWRRRLFTDHGIEFPPIYYEDTQTVLPLLFYANRVVVLPLTLYNYTQREGSIVHTFRPDVQNDYLSALAHSRVFLEEQGVFPDYRRPFRYYGLKSLGFIWCAVLLHHWQSHCARGMGGNLSRSFRYLNYYSGSRFRLDDPRPPAHEVLRPQASGEKPAAGKRNRPRGFARTIVMSNPLPPNRSKLKASQSVFEKSRD